jgi:hypothetical protein
LMRIRFRIRIRYLPCDADPVPHRRDNNLRPLMCRPPTAPFLSLYASVSP